MTLKVQVPGPGSRAVQPESDRASKTSKPPADTPIRSRTAGNAAGAQQSLPPAPQNKHVLQARAAASRAVGIPAAAAPVLPEATQAGSAPAERPPQWRGRPSEKTRGVSARTADRARQVQEAPVQLPAVALPDALDITQSDAQRLAGTRVTIPDRPRVRTHNPSDKVLQKSDEAAAGAQARLSEIIRRGMENLRRKDDAQAAQPVDHGDDR
jgi:hypothetical protein